MDRVYIDSIHIIKNAKAFAYQDESKKFFEAISFEFVALVELFSRKKKDDEFYNEIRANDSNLGFLTQLDNVMSRQYNFMSTNLQNAMSNFFYDREEFDAQIKVLVTTFDSVVTNANIDKLLTRDRIEIDEIYNMSEGNDDYPQIPYYLLQEQISVHDRLMYEEFGTLPERAKSNEKLGHRNFISAIGASYVWIFNNLEKRIKLYIPNYEIKLDERLDKNDNQIVLKAYLNNDNFKEALYNFLKAKYIDCEYEHFYQLFINCNSKLSWKGTLHDLTLIFKGTKSHSFTDPNYVILEALTRCFTSNGKELNYNSLKTSHSRCLKESVKTKYDKILTFLKNY
ncbi:hypothetical protein [Pedobacter sp. UBA4863]|nr:hypothetical protein [Pedobacter sp. UBA4863]